MALPAVLPATAHEPHMDSHRIGVRQNCKPEISNAHGQDSFRVYAEEDVNSTRSVC